MNTTTSQPPESNDAEVKTQGTTGKAIFDVLSKLIRSPSVLTFDGKPYDDSLATQDYSFLVVSDETFGYIGQPDQTITWFDFDEKYVLQQSDVSNADSLDVQSLSDVQK